VFRVVIALMSAVAVQLAAFGAPLFHAHLDSHDDDAHHGSARVHAHLAAHQHTHTLVDHDDPALAGGAAGERATAVQLFVAVEPALFLIPALPPSRYTLAAPMQSMMRRPPAVVHTHDPPGRGLAPSRAPPSFPVLNLFDGPVSV
jgi:hypothetical protein